MRHFILGGGVVAALLTCVPAYAKSQPEGASPQVTNANRETLRVKQLFDRRVEAISKGCDFLEYFILEKYIRSTLEAVTSRRDLYKNSTRQISEAEKKRRAVVTADLNKAAVDLNDKIGKMYTACGPTVHISDAYNYASKCRFDEAQRSIDQIKRYLDRFDRSVKRYVDNRKRLGSRAAAPPIDLQHVSAFRQSVLTDMLGAEENLQDERFRQAGKQRAKVGDTCSEPTVVELADISGGPEDASLEDIPLEEEAPGPDDIEFCDRDENGWVYPEYAQACASFEPFLGRWHNAAYGGTIEFYVEQGGTLGARVLAASERMEKHGYYSRTPILRGFQPAGVNGATWQVWANGGEFYAAKMPDREPDQTYGVAQWIAGRNVVFIQTSDPNRIDFAPQLELRLSDGTPWRR